jgi:hypothetical protein
VKKSTSLGRSIIGIRKYTAQGTGLIINQEKTKYVTVSKKTYNQYKKIAIGGYRFESVSSFSNEGSTINEDNSIS